MDNGFEKHRNAIIIVEKKIAKMIEKSAIK